MSIINGNIDINHSERHHTHAHTDRCEKKLWKASCVSSLQNPNSQSILKNAPYQVQNV